MENKYIMLITATFIVMGAASANIVFDHSDSIVFNTQSEFNQDAEFNSQTSFNSDLDLESADLLGFPNEACGSGEAVVEVQQDGTPICGSITSEAQAKNLSEVLTEGNKANQKINMTDYKITDLADPGNLQDATNKRWVEELVSNETIEDTNASTECSSSQVLTGNGCEDRFDTTDDQYIGKTNNHTAGGNLNMSNNNVTHVNCLGDQC